jgi:glyoxylase-like metal-dependent hydrolase (beta-lactamase superfamily II)
MQLRRAAVRCTLVLLMAASSACPQAAEPRPDNAGWYRMQIGRIAVTALCDGTLDMPVLEVFARPGPTQLQALLARARLPATVPTAVNAFVIDSGERIVMVDTGTGASRMFGSQLGQVLTQLRAAGYQPEQIDEIYLTHMHTDHVGGLTTADGRAVFPNAVVRAEAHEAGHYLSREKLAAAGGDKEDFESAIAMLAPYVASGRFKPFEGRTALAAGVWAQPTPGHTPGHTVYMIESDGQKLLLWGDLMHVAAVQFPQPAATVSFEASQRQSAAIRQQLFRQAAADGSWIAAAHVGFPGIGQLRSNGRGGYDWLPVTMLRGR